MSAVVTAAPAADARPACEVADIVRRYGDAYRQRYAVPLAHQRVLQALADCRTAALGGHLEECDRCGHQRPVYNSCRNRHCPKCQALAKAQWLADRQAELLPVGYFHNVFTLPHELNDLAAANPRALYTQLFASAADTLQAFAADPQYGLGGQLGFTAVLHTWDQKLLYHVHLHCVIAGGALACDGRRWLPTRRHYLFPVRALSRAFRDHFLAGLQERFRQGQLLLPGRLAALAEPAAFAAFVQPLGAKDWVVFSQRPFAGPEKVLDYLSRYTHRVAISNHRLRSVDDGRVTFDYRDRRDGNRVKHLTVSAVEFLRRFLLHVLPLAFCRIRHYGFLSNRVKDDRLARCRELLGQAAAAAVPRDPVVLLERLTGMDVTRCPHCGEGTMVVVQRLFAVPGPPAEPAAPCPADSS